MFKYIMNSQHLNGMRIQQISFVRFQQICVSRRVILRLNVRQ